MIPLSVKPVLFSVENVISRDRDQQCSNATATERQQLRPASVYILGARRIKLATVDIGVNLPASTAPEQPRPDKPVFVTIKPDETIAVGETVVPREQLSAALDAATNNHKDETIFVRGDKTLSYGALMEVMNNLRDAGYLKLALVGLETPSAKQ